MFSEKSMSVPSLGGSITASRGLTGLDFLRGCAAWLVVIPHFFLFRGDASAPVEFLSVFAVEIFFVLSGFVLGSQLDRCFSTPTGATLRTFYVRRWMRTLPTYFIALTLTAAASGAFLHAPHAEYAILIRTWLSVPPDGEFFLTAWSLAVEEWFYLLFPPVLMVARYLGIGRLTAVAVFAAAFLAVKLGYAVLAPDHADNLRRITLVRLDSIAVGYLTFTIFQGLRAISASTLRLLWGAAFAGIFLSYWVYAAELVFAFVYVAGGTAALIVLATASSEPAVRGRKLFAKLSAFGAHTSYAAYIYHLVVFQVLAGLPLGQTTAFTVYVLVVGIAAVLSFYLVERPFLAARPSYGVQQDQAGGNRLFAKMLTNLAVCGAIMVAAEFGARGIVFLYQSGHVSQRLAEHGAVQPVDAPPATALDGDHSEIAFARDHTANEAMPGSAFHYSTFSVYGNRPFASETVNINANGERAVPQAVSNIPGASPLRIWVFGASPVFGATNADAWTIPARLAVHMSKNPWNRPVEVRNFAVVGYLSWQNLISFQKALMANPPPDVVVAFSTNNDLERSWIDPTDDCSHLTITGVGSEQVLNRAWENLSHGVYVFPDELVNSWERAAPGLLEIRRLIAKIGLVMEARLKPDQIKADYARRRESYNARALACMDRQIEAFGNNLGLMASLARSKGAAFFAGSLPTLSTTSKALTGREVVEKYTKETYFFALTDDELAQFPVLPNERLSQRYLVDHSAFGASVQQFEDRLKDVMAANGGIVLDMKREANRLGTDVQLFSTGIHFTHLGADFLAAEAAAQLQAALGTAKGW